MNRRTRVSITRRENADRSITYDLRWLAGGRLWRKTSGIRTGPRPGQRERDRGMNAARAAADEFSRELTTGAKPIEPAPIGRAVMEYLASIDGVQAASTVDAKARILNYLGSMGVLVTDITADEIHKWAELRKQHVKEPTVGAELCAFGAFLDWAFRRGYLPAVPLMPRIKPKRACPLPVEDARIRDVIESQPTPARVLAVRMLACTGLRAGELMHLPASAIHANGDGVFIHVPPTSTERTKHHERLIPLGPRLMAEIGPRREGDRLIPEIHASFLGLWCRPLMPKQFRQWYLSTLEVVGCQDYIIRALMGHRQDPVREAYSFRLADARPWCEKVEQIVYE